MSDFLQFIGLEDKPILTQFIEEVANKGLQQYQTVIQYGVHQGQSLYNHVVSGVFLIHYGYDSVYDAKNKVWYIVNRQTGKRTKEKAVNYPQVGFIKMMGIGTVLHFFVITTKELILPRYIRLGKFMSKARVAVTLYENPAIVSRQHQTVKYLLNPLDLPQGMQVTSYDTYNIHPVPLIRNANLTGQFMRIDNNLYLPAGMKFGIEFLQPSAAS